MISNMNGLIGKVQGVRGTVCKSEVKLIDIAENLLTATNDRAFRSD